LETRNKLEKMKKKITPLIILLCFMLSPLFLNTLFADMPPDPGGGPGSGDPPVGGGSPIGSGLVIMLGMATGYGIKKVYTLKNH